MAKAERVQWAGRAARLAIVRGCFARLGRLLRTDRAAGSAALAALAVVATTLVALGGSGHAVLPRISNVGAWLPNTDQGSVTHANGLSGQADARVNLHDAAGHVLTVVQDGSTTLIEDTTTGTVSRIDPAQLTVTQSVSYGSADVQVVAGAGLAYVVDPVKGS